MKKELVVIMGMIGMMIAMYLLLAFYSVSFNIATWVVGARFVFTFSGIFVLLIGIAGITVYRLEN